MKRKNQVWIAFAATALMVAVMQTQGRPMVKSGHSIVAFELAKTNENALHIIHDWGAEVVQIAITNTWIDFIFILAYGSFAVLCCLSLGENQLVKKWQMMSKVMARMAIFACMCDVVENFLMLQTLSGSMQSVNIIGAYYFALTKFILLAIVFIFCTVLKISNLLKK